MKSYPGLNHRSGKKAAHWKGGRHIISLGYAVLRVNKKDVYEHRFVMEKKLGRKLRGNEIVHHRNHDKLDNRPENLTILNRSDHMRYHAKERWIHSPEKFKIPENERCGSKRSEQYGGYCRRRSPCYYHPIVDRPICNSNQKEASRHAEN